jgi:hypothetical protein
MEKKDLMEKVDKIDLQVLQKKIKQNPLHLQITQSILEKNLQKTHLLIQKKKALDLKVKKNLKVERADLKTLALKNIVKKELNLKIFYFFLFFASFFLSDSILVFY